MLLGDTNIDITKFNLVSPVTNYVNSLFSVGCNFHIDKPTRITSSSASCIDHVYSNIPTECLENHIILSDASDHFGIVTKLRGATNVNYSETIYYRKSRLSDHEWEHFNKELKYSLSQKLSNCLLVNNDADTSAEVITQVYLDLIDKFMPQRKLSRKQKRFRNKPWITKGMKVSIKTKNKLFKMAKQSDDYDVLQKYRAYRDLLSKVKLKARHNHYSDLAIRYGNDKSKVWRLINDISKRKRPTRQSIKSLVDRNG